MPDYRKHPTVLYYIHIYTTVARSLRMSCHGGNIPSGVSCPSGVSLRSMTPSGLLTPEAVVCGGCLIQRQLPPIGVDGPPQFVREQRLIRRQLPPLEWMAFHSLYVNSQKANYALYSVICACLSLPIKHAQDEGMPYSLGSEQLMLLRAGHSA